MSRVNGRGPCWLPDTGAIYSMRPNSRHRVVAGIRSAPRFFVRIGPVHHYQEEVAHAVNSANSNVHHSAGDRYGVRPGLGFGAQPVAITLNGTQAVCAPGREATSCRLNDVLQIVDGAGMFANAGGSLRNERARRWTCTCTTMFVSCCRCSPTSALRSYETRVPVRRRNFLGSSSRSETVRRMALA